MDGMPFEWRWVDDKGRGMTPWKSGAPPPVLDLRDCKGAMHVEVRIKKYGYMTASGDGDSGVGE